jgi:hypothetical protein
MLCLDSIYIYIYNIYIVLLSAVQIHNLFIYIYIYMDIDMHHHAWMDLIDKNVNKGGNMCTNKGTLEYL